MVCDVQLELKNRKVDKPFTYDVPIDMQADISVGKRVLVPFGARKLEGFIVAISHNHNSSLKLKPIIKIIDTSPIINEELSDKESKILFL